METKVEITGVFDDLPITMTFASSREACAFMLKEEKQYIERGLRVTVLEHGFDVRGTWIDYTYRFA